MLNSSEKLNHIPKQLWEEIAIDIFSIFVFFAWFLFLAYGFTVGIESGAEQDVMTSISGWIFAVAIGLLGFSFKLAFEVSDIIGLRNRFGNTG